MKRTRTQCRIIRLSFLYCILLLLFFRILIKNILNVQLFAQDLSTLIFNTLCKYLNIILVDINLLFYLKKQNKTKLLHFMAYESLISFIPLQCQYITFIKLILAFKEMCIFMKLKVERCFNRL